MRDIHIEKNRKCFRRENYKEKSGGQVLYVAPLEFNRTGTRRRRFVNKTEKKRTAGRKSKGCYKGLIKFPLNSKTGESPMLMNQPPRRKRLCLDQSADS